MSKPFAPTRLYIKRHIKTGKLYFGKHEGKNIKKYLGSGEYWKKHIARHGKEFVEHVWNSDWFSDENEASSFALSFSEIFNIVESDEWANKVPEDGKSGGSVKGFVTVRDKSGSAFKVPITHPDYLSGELVHISAGTVVVKDTNGKVFRTSCDDPRLKTGELVSPTKGTFMETLTCPHCGFTGRGGNMGRYHLDNCLKNTAGSPPTRVKLNRPVRTCPHCGLVGHGSNMARYHFNNCPKLVSTNLAAST